MNPTTETKCGFVSLAGVPNVGKSTLLNRILGEQLAIVSPKPQTTWRVVRGILTEEPGQIIFVDTPGLHRTRDNLGSYMVSAAREAITGADLLYWMIDCRSPLESSEKLIRDHLPARVPVFLLINKIDRLPKPELLPLIDHFRERYPFKEIVPISALKGENVEKLLRLTWDYLPSGPPLFPPEYLSDEPERRLAGEFIREQVFLLTYQEIPYSVAVMIEAMEERDEGKKVYIRAFIYVERESQKGILLGKKGAKIKQVGTAARKRIEGLIGVPVYLDLTVKVRKQWRRSVRSLREFGFR